LVFRGVEDWCRVSHSFNLGSARQVQEQTTHGTDAANTTTQIIGITIGFRLSRPPFMFEVNLVPEARRVNGPYQSRKKLEQVDVSMAEDAGTSGF
jgi:hypothetical protein